MSELVTIRRTLFLVLPLYFLLGQPSSIIAISNFCVLCATERSIESKILQMAAKFRDLRTISGHFTGDTWNDDVDRWMGRKHKLMLELGSLLATGEYRKREVTRLLDPPDQIARQGDRLFKLIASLPGYSNAMATPYEFLIYYWRGEHDFLFFTCRDSVIISSDWWYGRD